VLKDHTGKIRISRFFAGYLQQSRLAGTAADTQLVLWLQGRDW